MEELFNTQESLPEQVFQPLLITPQANCVRYLFTAQGPLAYGASDGDKSNVSLHQRRNVIIQRPGHAYDEAELEASISQFCTAFPVPAETVYMFDTSIVNILQFVAASMVKLFLDEYAKGEKESVGLMADLIKRHGRLQDRFRQQASRSTSLANCWFGTVTAMKQSPMRDGKGKQLFELLKLHPALQSAVLTDMSRDMGLAYAVGREWHNEAKRQSKAYADASGAEQSDPTNVTLSFPIPAEAALQSSEVTVSVPHISENGIRHMLREALMYHLLHTLDIEPESLSPTMKAFLENAGSMAGSQGENEWRASWGVRGAYPHIGLLGASRNKDIMYSNLKVHSFVVCQENSPQLSLYFDGMESHTLSTALFDVEQINRLPVRNPEIPMPTSVEVLKRGTQVAVRFVLHPTTTELEAGALSVALQTFHDCLSHFGGRSARGYGLVTGKPLDADAEMTTWLAECQAKYEQYLADNKEALREGLLVGNLGQDKPMVF